MSKSKRQKPNKPDAEEQELESILFGANTASNISTVATDNNTTSSTKTPQPDSLFWFDNGQDEADDTTNNTSNASSTGSKKAANKRAWTDAADASLEVDLAAVNRTRKLRKTQEENIVDGTDYQERLREQFNKANAHTGAASWATPADINSDGEDDDDQDTDVSHDPLRSTASVLSGGKGGPLPATELRVLRLKDANATSPSSASIQSVQFMKRNISGASSGSSVQSASTASTPLLLTAGFDKTLRLFSIDGKTNRKVQSVFVRDFPIHHAEFAPTSDEIILSSRRSFFYVYDLQAAKVSRIPTIVGREEKSLETFKMSPDGKYITFLGNDGYAIMVDRKTKRWLFDLKMNGSIRTCSYSSDGNQMYTSGSDGQVYIWDLRMRKCLDRHTDEGCVRATALSVSPNGSMYACGANSGCVNLYKKSLGDGVVVNYNSSKKSLSKKKKKLRGPLGTNLKLQRAPFKTIMSLTTRADVVKFNHDGQILAIASQMKKDSLRLIHARSGTVFSNWPTGQTPLRYVTDIDFSPNSGLCAIGNDRGKVLLYRMLHYGRV